MPNKDCKDCGTHMLGFRKLWNPTTGQYKLLISEGGNDWIQCGPIFDTTEQANVYREQEVRLRRYH